MESHCATELVCLADLVLHCHSCLDPNQPLRSGPLLWWPLDWGTAFIAAIALTDSPLTCCVQLAPKLGCHASRQGTARPHRQPVVGSLKPLTLCRWLPVTGQGVTGRLCWSCAWIGLEQRGRRCFCGSASTACRGHVRGWRGACRRWKQRRWGSTRQRQLSGSRWASP